MSSASNSRLSTLSFSGWNRTMVAMPSSIVKRRRLNMSERFDDGDVGDPTAFAHRLQAVTKAAREQAMNERRHELGSARATWVPKRERAAVNVDVAVVGAPPRQAGERYRCDRLDDLSELAVD